MTLKTCRKCRNASPLGQSPTIQPLMRISCMKGFNHVNSETKNKRKHYHVVRNGVCIYPLVRFFFPTPTIILTCAGFNGNGADCGQFQIGYKFISFFLLFSFPFVVSAIYAAACRVSPQVRTSWAGGSIARCTTPSASNAACL